jgi:hypothetical protein
MRLACPSCQKPFEADDDLAGAPGLLLCESCLALAATPPPHVPRPRLLSSPFLDGPESGDPVSLRDLEPNSDPNSDAEPVSVSDLEPASLPDLDSVAAVAPPPSSFGIGLPRKPVIPKVLPNATAATPVPVFAAIRIPAPRASAELEPPSEDEPKREKNDPTPAAAAAAEPTPTVPSAVEPTSVEPTPDSAEADRRVLAMRHEGDGAPPPDSGVVGLHGGIFGEAKPKPSVLPPAPLIESKTRPPSEPTSAPVPLLPLVEADESMPSSRKDRTPAEPPGLLAPVLQLGPATPRSKTPGPAALAETVRPAARETGERTRPSLFASWSLAVSAVSISAAVIVVTLYGRDPAPTAASADSARTGSAPQGETAPAPTQAHESARPTPQQEPAPTAVASATSVPTVATSAGPTRPAVATSAATTAATPATTTPQASPSPPATAPAPASAGAAFDKTAAKAALAAGAAQAAACKQPDDPEGGARVLVTFAPSGRVQSAQVVGSPFQGTRTGACIARAFKGLTVPAFDGEPVVVTKDVSIH